MNTEDKLRRASREIDRVTASLTPPPITDVHRSARMQGIGIALAGAAAVFVLVGGAVLLLNGNGATTLEPAGPGVATTTAIATSTSTTDVTATTAVAAAAPDETTTTAPAVSCSAGDLAPAAPALSSIPQPVARTLGEIVDAARQCDFDRLANIGGDDFTASFGDSDPAAFWAAMEDSGEEPMYPLLKILDMPYGTIETEQGALYVWPSAFAHQGSWETTPETDVDALRSLYSDEDLQGFADFGGYVGYRIGIWENGDWSFFVAGD